MKLAKNTKILVGIFVGFVVLLAVVLLTRTVLNNTSTSSQASDKVVVEDSKTGRKATFSRDGYVYFVDEDGNEYAVAWGNEKISSFFDYITSNWKTSESGYLVSLNGQEGGISADDELIQTVLDELSGSDDDDSGSGGGGLSDLFSSPTPASSGSGSTGGGGSGDTGGSGGSTLPPPAPSWCKHWKLSYCADPIYRSPSPTPLSSFPPEVIQAKDCDEWNAQVDTKTVISNFSCSEEGQ